MFSIPKSDTTKNMAFIECRNDHKKQRIGRYNEFPTKKHRSYLTWSFFAFPGRNWLWLTKVWHHIYMTRVRDLWHGWGHQVTCLCHVNATYRHMSRHVNGVKRIPTELTPDSGGRFKINRPYFSRCWMWSPLLRVCTRRKSDQITDWLLVGVSCGTRDTWFI